MPKRFDQMTILERGDIKLECREDIRAVREWKKNWRQRFNYGFLIISISAAIYRIWIA